ncbi:MAG: hypothetical protein K9J83_02150 [Desulfarculaceae bacterium]|nr:hypothetical protein [Desulfarculaceae bacterium]
MSRFKKEIDALLEKTFTTDETGCKAEVSFDTDFIGFNGHFPNAPVLPGIVMIQLAVMMCERAVGESLHIAGIREAKFTEPVLPREKITAFLSPAEETENGLRVKGSFNKQDKTAARVSLLLETDQKES